MSDYITSYEMALALCRKGRRKVGKKLTSLIHIRRSLTTDHAIELFWIGKKPKFTGATEADRPTRVMAIIRPDDTAEVFFGHCKWAHYKRWLGLWSVPYNKRLHVVWHEMHTKWYDTVHRWPDWEHHRETAAPLKDGMIFDLQTGNCLNPSRRPRRVVDKEKSGAWRSKLIQFHKQLEVTAKMGAFEHYFDGPDVLPTSTPVAEPKLIHKWIDEGDVDAFARSTLCWAGHQARWNVSYRGMSPGAVTKNVIRAAYKQHLDDVRRLAGCWYEQ